MTEGGRPNRTAVQLAQSRAVRPFALANRWILTHSPCINAQRVMTPPSSGGVEGRPPAGIALSILRRATADCFGVLKQLPLVAWRVLVPQNGQSAGEDVGDPERVPPKPGGASCPTAKGIVSVCLAFGERLDVVLHIRVAVVGLQERQRSGQVALQLRRPQPRRSPRCCAAWAPVRHPRQARRDGARSPRAFRVRTPRV